MAIDGKSSRPADAPAAHLLATMDRRTGCAPAQVRVPAGTNEHKAALVLLEATVLRGRVITGDAVFCQRELCRQVVADGGRYLIKVDDNQPTLKADIATAAEPASPPRSAGEAGEATTLDKHGGRVERCRLRLRTMLDGYPDWPGVAQVGRLEREVNEGGDTESTGSVTIEWGRCMNGG